METTSIDMVILVPFVFMVVTMVMALFAASILYAQEKEKTSREKLALRKKLLGEE